MKVGNQREFLKGLGVGIGSLSLFGIQAKNAYTEIKQKAKKNGLPS